MIMISGGEHLMLKNLVELIDHFRDKGLKIGLSTHGIYPDRLKTLLPKLDYVALDIKSDDPKVYEFLDLIKNNDLNQDIYIYIYIHIYIYIYIWKNMKHNFSKT